jgi:hypothetical protein
MDHLVSREVALQGDHVIELEEPFRIDPHPELEWSGILGAYDPSNRCLVCSHCAEGIRGL